MDIKIIPAYDHLQEIRELFSEYTEMLISGDPAFKEYLEIQNYDDELEHLEDKYGMPAGRLYLAYCDGNTAGCIGLKKLDDEVLSVNGKEYRILKLLGKGKGGYSYLSESDQGKVVLKQIHHEPCDYYQFGNKIEAEINDYKRLKEIGIALPEMLDVDTESERIIKEYIDGDTVYEMVLKDKPLEECLRQVKKMCCLLYAADINIDYFPTNFIMQDSVLYYVDYECNKYMEKWNFENWGMKYWSKTPEFLKYAEEHSSVVAKFTTTAQTKKFI